LFKTKVMYAALVLGLLAPACSKSLSESKNQSVPVPASAVPRIASVNVVKATPQEAVLQPGASVEALVSLKIDAGYHVNANPPSYPYLKATELEVQSADGISVSFFIYPDPITKKFSFADKPLAVYEGNTTLKVQLKADKSAKSGSHSLPAKLRVQACDDQVCYAPGTIDLTIPVVIL
jgi:Thiol:disulfide interchange protein DsbD, N-terminal